MAAGEASETQYRRQIFKIVKAICDEGATLRVAGGCGLKRPTLRV
jgi:hypothetical protein